MQKILLTLLLAAGSLVRAEAQISLVNVTTCGPATFPAMTCTIPATGAGHLIVIAWGAINGGETAVISNITDNATGGTNVYAEVPGARSIDRATGNNEDIWYAKNSKSGATAITVTPSTSGTSGTALIWEFAGADTTAPLDQGAGLNSQMATSVISGAPILTSSPNEVIVSVAKGRSGVAGIHSGNAFTSDSVFSGGGYAHLFTSRVGTFAAVWESPSTGSYSSSSASFKMAAVASTMSGALSGALAASSSACDLNNDGAVNVIDVQLMTNMYLGVTACNANIVGPGICTIPLGPDVLVNDVVSGALGGHCPHSITMNWGLSSGATSYNVYRAGTSGGPYTLVNTAPLATNNYQDYAVYSGQTYYYVITALNSSGESSYSPETSATIPTP